LLGRFNIGNVLAIIGVLSVLDFSLDQIKKAVSQLVTVEGRMQIIDSHNKPTIVVDYAHTPDALEKALIAIGEHFPGNVFCVFGCGGDRDKDKRPLMAQVAERYASKVVVTSDNSRSESLQQIWSEIQCGFSDVENVSKIADRGRAIAFAVQSAGIDDIVFLAGMGHEFVVTEASQSYPMKDLDMAQQALLQYGV